jgi:hypothetical protein
MEAGGELILQGIVDHPMGGDPAPTPERFGDDFHAKVGLAFGSVTGVALVEMRLVHHFKRGRPKSLG